MDLKKMISREIKIIILTVILVCLGFIAFSFAVFFDIDNGGTNVIAFGNIELSLCNNTDCSDIATNLGNRIGVTTDGEGNTVPVLQYPTSDAEGILTDPYKFVITNTGNLDLTIKVILERDTSFEIATEYSDYSSFTPVDDSAIKISFNKTGLTPTVLNYSEAIDGVIAQNIIIEAQTSEIFELRSWVSSSAPNTSQGTHFVTLISAQGEFVPEL